MVQETQTGQKLEIDFSFLENLSDVGKTLEEVSSDPLVKESFTEYLRLNTKNIKNLLIIDPSFILKRYNYTKEGENPFYRSGLSIDVDSYIIDENNTKVKTVKTLGTKPAYRALQALLSQLMHKQYDTVILAYDCPPYKRLELSEGYKQDRVPPIDNNPEETFYNKYLMNDVIFNILNLYKIQVTGCEFDDTASWILENFNYESADVLSNDSDLFCHFSNPMIQDKIALSYPEKGQICRITKDVFIQKEENPNVIIPNFWKFYHILSGGHNNLPKFRPGMAKKGALTILNDMVLRGMCIDSDSIIAYLKTTTRGISEDEIERLVICDEMQDFPLKVLDYRIYKVIGDYINQEKVLNMLELNVKHTYQEAIKLISLMYNCTEFQATKHLDEDTFYNINK